MVTFASITGGGGSAETTINQAGGSDSGIMGMLTSPIVLIGGAAIAYFVMGD